MMLTDAVDERISPVNPVRRRRNRGQRHHPPVREQRWTTPDKVVRIAGQAALLGDPIAALMIITAAWTDVRLAEVKQIHAAVPAGQRAMMAGDWNSITSRRTAAEGEPQHQFAAMAPATRYGKGIWPPAHPNGDTDPDTRALDYLVDSEWICKAIALNNTVPTVTPGYEAGGELIIDRCLTRGPIALHSMWVDTSRIPYSDHRALGGVVTIVGDLATVDETP